MTPPLACDFLYEPASPAAIKAAGYETVLTYLRVLTKTRVAAYHAVGLNVGPIFETLATEALGGAAKGAADGALVRSQCQALGQPAGSAVWFNVSDFQPTATQIAALSAYLEAFETALGDYAYGPYGTSYVINTLAHTSRQLWWQNAENDNGVPGDIVNPAAVLYQRVTPTLAIAGASPGSWDEDVVVNTASPPWWGPATKPTTPTPTTKPATAPPTGLTVTPAHVLIKGGLGWCASPVPATRVVSVLPFDQNPAVIGRYDSIPDFAGVATQPGPGAPDGVLTFRGGANGVFGVYVWSV